MPRKNVQSNSPIFWKPKMHSITRILVLSTLSFAAMSALAASYYCLETNQVVNEGDSMEKVQNACGTPTQVIIRDDVTNTPTEITEWVYMTNRPIDPTRTSDYLPYLTVVFDNQGKVTQLRQNQQSDFNEQTLNVQNPKQNELLDPNKQNQVTCQQGSIKIGDDMPTVQITCGTPTLVNKMQSSQDVTKKIVEWNYQKNSSPTPLKFLFENGILRQIKNGP